MKALRRAGVRVAVLGAGLVAALTVSVGVADWVPFKCGDQTYQACDPPGRYDCCSWNGYPCSTGGTSTHKEGFIFDFNICVWSNNPNDTCTVQPVQCQQDWYFKSSGCDDDFCNSYTRYVMGCVHNIPVP